MLPNQKRRALQTVLFGLMLAGFCVTVFIAKATTSSQNTGFSKSTDERWITYVQNFSFVRSLRLGNDPFPVKPENSTRNADKPTESDAPTPSSTEKRRSNSAIPTSTDTIPADVITLNNYEQMKEANPRVQLDPSKILYPALLWGPNNQLEGLRESVLIAIKLNRTLVVPYFFPQHNDRSGPRIHLVSPFNRIDVVELANFVSVISVEDMRSQCNGTFNIAFQSRPRWCEAVKEVQQDVGMEILNASSMPEHSARFRLSGKPGPSCWQPQISAIPDIGKETRHNVNKLQETFNTTAQCAVLLFPYLSLSLTFMGGTQDPNHRNADIIKNLTNTELIKTAPLPLLVDAIEHATGRPPYVKKVAERFLKEIINSSVFIAVHWRYDAEMMRSVCNQKSALCGEKPSPRDVANALRTVQRQVGESHKTEVPFYIAAPPTIADFIEEVRTILENTTSSNVTSPAASSSRVYALKDLNAFLEKRYPAKQYPDIRPTPNELVSIVEMEISSRSTAFLCSSGSTWSAMVLRTRSPKFYPFDTSLMHLIIKLRNASR